jgi:hypothetical protein
MSKYPILLFICVCMFFVLLSPVTAQEQTQLSVTDSSATMNFPLSLKITSQINSSVNITDVRIRYSIDQMSFADVISEANVPFHQSNNVDASWSLDMRRLGGLPPGSNLNYWWWVKDQKGSLLETTPIKLQINDDRYKWNNLTQDKISLNWYSGDINFAQSLMNTAQESLAKLTRDTGISPSKAISIYIYANSKDLQGSMIYPQEWTGGVAFTSFNVIAIGIEPIQLVWGKGAMTHELTHVVTYQMTFNPYNDLPVWLNEGLAMYSEGELSTQYSSPLKSAVSQDTLLSVRTISSPFSAFTDRSLLSYAESFSLINYLISSYGSGKMTQLLHTFQQGSTDDGAFLSVYGFDMDELNNLWKTWLINDYSK